jgi:hyaluronoglucosaminidase
MHFAPPPALSDRPSFFSAPRYRAVLAAAVLVMTGVGLTSVVGRGVAAASPANGSAGLPAVFPVPQSEQRHGGNVPIPSQVTVVVGAHGDASALSVVDTALNQAGARRINQVSDATAPGPHALTVYVGGDSENAQTASALSALGIAGPSGLPAQGYVLGVGRVQGGAVVVLDGVDAAGTYYAAQTLRQLVSRAPSGISLLPGVAIRDWPSLPTRGVVEGFYGDPWSDQDRMAQFDFYGANKMNTYVYSPKNDPYLRASWRDPYPPAQLAELQSLVQRATADHVTFTYALSPGLSLCYSSASDEQALVAKFQSLWDIGVRAFAVPFDDISYTTWNCSADQAKFGTGPAAAAAAQAYVLNAVDADFIATHPGAQPLETVPTEYYDTAASPYKTTMAAQLTSDIVVEWTGDGVIPAAITASQAQAAKQVYGHDILLWDNYPVNDYNTSRLFLGPLAGRDAGLAGQLAGMTSNPMIQAAPSEIPLFTAADFMWNSAAYDPSASWNASLAAFAGHDPATLAALHAFADVNYSSVVNQQEAPSLSATIAAFWKAWNGGHPDPGATSSLGEAFAELRDGPGILRTRLSDPSFATEAGPWLDATAAWGDAELTALDMLIAQSTGDGTRAWTDRLALPGLEATAKSYTYTGLNGTAHVVVGSGVLDTFIQNALNENTTWMHAYPHPTGQASMAAYQNYVPANMVDGDPSTFYWSDFSPNPGDYVGVDLGTVRPVNGIDVLMAKSDRPDDYMHTGTIEYSADGTNWTSAGSFANLTEVKATFPAGTTARYLRLVDTGTQSNWVVVDEFTVLTPPLLDVTGAPAPAAGSSFAAAADGDLDTVYRAANAPQPGDALTGTLPAPTSLDSVIIAQSGSPSADADVQVDVEGTWRTVGELTGGYTKVSLDGLEVSAIRLRWAPGSAAPAISDIIPIAASSSN